MEDAQELFADGGRACVQLGRNTTLIPKSTNVNARALGFYSLRGLLWIFSIVLVNFEGSFPKMSSLIHR
ncbi:hypothetical protein J6590_066201 [Homalodisca vitripennis]|nr:hypothetical protein J6590_066201 [Homalodisca vitripennis]